MSYIITCKRCKRDFKSHVLATDFICKDCYFDIITTPTLKHQRTGTAPLRGTPAIEVIEEKPHREVFIAPLPIPWGYYVNIALLILLLILFAVR